MMITDSRAWPLNEGDDHGVPRIIHHDGNKPCFYYYYYYYYTEATRVTA